MNELAVLTTYYNFCNYESVKNNYKVFSSSIDKIGLPLYTAEVSINNQPFHLQPNTEHKQEIIYQYRTNSYIWYKENLINLMVDKLPPEIKYVAWIDADILFSNNQWPEATIKSLEDYPVTQLFCKIIRNDRREYPNVVCTSVPYWLKYKDSEEVAPMVPGGAWACRREILSKYRLYDKHSMGGGDSFFMFSLYGWWEDRMIKDRLYPDSLIENYLNWAKPLHEEVKGNVGFIPGTITHLWHGERSNRQYYERIYLLKVCNYNPTTDLIYRSDGLLEWKNRYGLLQTAVKHYMIGRKEDG